MVQALARAGLTGNPVATARQVARLAERLESTGPSREAKSLRALLARHSRLEAVEPLNLSTARATESTPHPLQRLGKSTSPPVDRESGAPLCEIVVGSANEATPVLPAQAEWACESLLREWQREGELVSLGLPVSRSLLVYGPPGTGKSTLARDIAQRLGRPAVVVRLDGLISSLLGNTARNLGTLFDFCNRYECVLILDEFDAVAKIRDDVNEVGEIKRVVNALLQNLDKRVEYGLTIAVTNHEKLLDNAVWRRFEQQIHLGLPEGDVRLSIARRLLVSSDVDDALAWVVALATQGKSGADVRSLTLAALKHAVLAGEPKPSGVDLLRMAARSTGAQGLDVLSLDDRLLARRLAEAFDSMSNQDLATVFGRDRRTIARWGKGD